MIIESLNNEKIKYYTKLQNKKYREETGLYIAPGEHLVREALALDLVKDVFLLEGEENTYGNVTYVKETVMKKLSGLESAPKVLAVVRKNVSNEITGNVVILDDLRDPGNIGTIIRSAVAFNYETIIISPNSADIYNIKTIRATEGMLYKINIVIKNLNEIIPDLKNKGYKIVGTDVQKGSHPYKISSAHALIIGSEAKGMSDDVKKLCDEFFYIPMNEKCESLNAGVSASILMYTQL